MTSSKSLVPFAAMIVLAVALVPLQSWIDARGETDPQDDADLYLTNGERAKVLALGYDSLVADVYWMRAIQFLGRRVLADRSVLEAHDGRLRTLAPLVDVSTTLDPRNIPPYRFGGFFVHDYVDAAEGRRIVEKGVRANPDNFRLYQDLAYLSWSDGDCDAASRYYAEGGALPNAPSWMAQMSASIHTKCGRADLAVEMLERQYESTDDPRIRAELREQLAMIEAQREVEYLELNARSIKQRTGQFPLSLVQLARGLAPAPGDPSLRVDRVGNPVDPSGRPYAYDPETGRVSVAGAR